MDAATIDVLKFVQVLLGRGWHWCEHDSQLLLHPVDHDLAVRLESDRLLASPQLEEHLKLIITSPVSKGRYWR